MHHRMTPLDIHDHPQVPTYRHANTRKREQSNHLASQSTRQARSGRYEPKPPFLGEFAVSLLVEFHVTENGEGHEEDEVGVEEDEPGLGDVTVVWC